ncbi:MAG: hypothetical protein ACHRHE_14040 [Tepidisphaerales bacterium]
MLATTTMLLLGSGALSFLHELQHQVDRRACATGEDRPAGSHDDSNCPVHAMLHSPILAAGIELSPVGLMEAAERPALAEQRVVSIELSLNLSCRGPPVL